MAARNSKPEATLEAIKEKLPFDSDPNFSVDEVYSILSILHDLSEQIWAQAKSKGSNQSLKSFVNTVSRPFSAFNRLGSFITWGSPRGSQTEKDLADLGFFYRESMTVSQYDNPAIELSDLSEKALFDREYLREYLGQSNRHLNSLVRENVPLYKTLNYFAAKDFRGNGEASQVLDVIGSVNSDFFLVANANGQFQICSASLSLPETRKFSVFDVEKT